MSRHFAMKMSLQSRKGWLALLLAAVLSGCGTAGHAVDSASTQSAVHRTAPHPKVTKSQQTPAENSSVISRAAGKLSGDSSANDGNKPDGNTESTSSASGKAGSQMTSSGPAPSGKRDSTDAASGAAGNSGNPAKSASPAAAESTEAKSGSAGTTAAGRAKTSTPSSAATDTKPNAAAKNGNSAAASGSGSGDSGAGTGSGGKSSTATNSGSSSIGHPYDHVVVVIEENHSYAQIVDSPKAPYMNRLIKNGALFTNSHGVTHPSQPNYLAIFSGSTQGVTGDGCGKPFDAPNLASELLKHKLTFTGYSEDLPRAGYAGCGTNVYARKHNPWVQFTNVPANLNQPLRSFPEDLGKLPTVSFVIPNVKEDMHSGTVQEADSWLKQHVGAYAEWAQTHNSLLIVTWDEDDFSPVNHIPTIFAGEGVHHGRYDQNINHYEILRFLEDMYKLPRLGHSANAAPLSGLIEPGK